MTPLLRRGRGGATGDVCSARRCGRCERKKPGPVPARPPCPRELGSLRCESPVRRLTLTDRVGVPEWSAGAEACMWRLRMYCPWPRGAPQLTDGAGNAVSLRVQHSRDLQLARPWLAAPSALGGDSEVSLGSNQFATRGDCSAALLGHHACSCARCWHSDGAAGECSPETSRLVHTGSKVPNPGCLTLWANGGNGSRAHFCSATFGRHVCNPPSLRPFSRAQTTIFATFQAPFSLSKSGPWELEKAKTVFLL